MPFDIAHALAESGPEGEAESLAYAVAFGTIDGGEFDWSDMRWLERNG